MIKFKSEELNLLVEAGRFIDKKSREFIRDRIGLKKKKVEPKRHTILSGPPGVGKTYGTQDECNKGRVKYIKIEPGTSDISRVVKLATGVHSLKEDEELLCLLDDADDNVFSDYDTLNKWKIAMGDVDYEQGIIPTYNHSVSMDRTLQSLEKQAEKEPAKRKIIEALKAFMPNDSLGISIPMDRVRFLILCNLDLEDPKLFNRGKMKSAVEAIKDRIQYKRINVDWQRQWGWTAFVLGETQPFEDYKLTMNQKVELMQWMYSNWNKLRSTSFRTVKVLAAAMINEPDTYIDEWQNELKGH